MTDNQRAGVKRYELHDPPNFGYEPKIPYIRESEDGEYVQYSDYTALASRLATAERERDEARKQLNVPWRYEPTKWPCCGELRHPAIYHSCELMREWERFISLNTGRKDAALAKGGK